MKMNGLLTKELEAEFRDTFYLKLLHWKSKAPDFVRTKIKELNFPIRIKIKNEFNVFRIRVSKKLEKIINYHII